MTRARRAARFRSHFSGGSYLRARAVPPSGPAPGATPSLGTRSRSFRIRRVRVNKSIARGPWSAPVVDTPGSCRDVESVVPAPDRGHHALVAALVTGRPRAFGRRRRVSAGDVGDGLSAGQTSSRRSRPATGGASTGSPWATRRSPAGSSPGNRDHRPGGRPSPAAVPWSWVSGPSATQRRKAAVHTAATLALARRRARGPRTARPREPAARSPGSPWPFRGAPGPCCWSPSRQLVLLDLAHSSLRVLVGHLGDPSGGARRRWCCRSSADDSHSECLGVTWQCHDDASSSCRRSSCPPQPLRHDRPS